MHLNPTELAGLIRGMRNVYSRGGNAMAYARKVLKNESGEGTNSLTATLVAYDLQAGSYTRYARENAEQHAKWCLQLANLVAPFLPDGGSILEVGVGEATTLCGVRSALGGCRQAYGFDISWSRISTANSWLREHEQQGCLFVGDLFNIPLASGSIDVVYTSHSIEPNGGREKEALSECLRVARKAVVLVEPIYELASAEAQARMRAHGYIRGLHETAVTLGAQILEYRLLDHSINPLNPSGVLTLVKTQEPRSDNVWRCPLTGCMLEEGEYGFFAREVGVVYPVLNGIPMLRAEHAVIASHWADGND